MTAAADSEARAAEHWLEWALRKVGDNSVVLSPAECRVLVDEHNALLARVRQLEAVAETAEALIEVWDRCDDDLDAFQALRAAVAAAGSAAQGNSDADGAASG